MEGFVLDADINERSFFRTLGKMKAGVKDAAKEMADDLGSIGDSLLVASGGIGRGMISGRGVASAAGRGGAGGLGRGNLGMGIGPSGRYENLYARSMIHLARGNTLSDDDQHMMRKAFRDKQRANPNFGSGLSDDGSPKPSGESAAMRMILSSRVNMGPFSPLMRDMYRMTGGSSGMMGGAVKGLAGLAEEIAPIAIPVALAVAASAAVVGGVIKLIEAGNAAALPMMRTMYATGSYGAGAGGGMALAGASGVDAASQAMSLAGSLRGGGIGAAIAHSAGIYDFGPYTVDKMKNYTAVNRLLRTLPADQATIMAREFGMTDNLIQRDMSPGMASMVEGVGRSTSMSPEMRRANADLQGYKQMGKSVLDYVLISLESAAVHGLVGIGDFFTGGSISKTMSAYATADKMYAAQQDNTQALQHMTRWLKEGQSSDVTGVGGPRSVGAVPLGMRLLALNQAAQNGAIFNGAYTIH